MNIRKSIIHNQYDVSLDHVQSRYYVNYGMQSTEHTSLQDAMREFQECVVHQETCAGYHDE